MASTDELSMSSISLVDSGTIDQFQLIERFEILGQPCYKSKLRYRSDFSKKRNRRAVLSSQNNFNYPSPTIRIPALYLNLPEQYYIRVCLVTVINKSTGCRYIHPYDLEDANNDEYNDPNTSSVWFPIEERDLSGIKRFPNLRIIRKTESALRSYGNLRVFDSEDSLSTSQLSSPKETIREFNLDRQQLAFTLGQKLTIDGILKYVAFAATTVFSDELAEIIGGEFDLGNTSTNQIRTRPRRLKHPICRIYRYAPRKGYPESHDEVMIFYEKSLRPEKYGNVEVLFEYDTPLEHWSEPVLDLDVHDKLVSFRTPRFPIHINNPTNVNIVLKQRKRSFESLQFTYIPDIVKCPECEQDVSLVEQTNPNKRSMTELHLGETQRTEKIKELNPITDTLLPINEWDSNWVENLNI